MRVTRLAAAWRRVATIRGGAFRPVAEATNGWYKSAASRQNGRDRRQRSGVSNFDGSLIVAC